MTRDGKTAFVTLGRAWHVARVDVATRTVEAYILAGSRVWGAALTADDSILVVTNGASDDISVIDTEARPRHPFGCSGAHAAHRSNSGLTSS